MKKFFSFLTIALMSASTFAANITVAEAVAIGKALAAKAETAEEYSVEGYVAKAYDYNSVTKTQTFYMSDEANVTEATEFQAYQCKLDKAVAAGTKIVVTGKILNHVTAKGAQTIRIKKGTGVPEGGEEPPVVGDPDVVFDKDDFAGKGTSSTGSEVTVTKDGVTFSCDKAYGDGQYGVRCYKNGVVSIKSETEQIGKIVFEFGTASGTYYNGGLAEEIVVNGKEWSATLGSQARMNLIKIYFGTAEPTPGPGPEPSGDAITVAKALEIAGALEQGKSTTTEYEVVGYVTAYAGKDEDGGWATYGNQMFWIADEKGSTAASNEAGALEVYQGKPTEKVYVGDKISVKAALTNYQGLLETSKGGVVTILEKATDRPDDPTPVDDANVTFLPADFEGQGQAATLDTPGGAVSTTKDGVTVSTDNGYGHNLALRVYKGANFSIKSETEQIGKIVFQFYSTYDGGLDKEVVVNAKEWSNTMSAQARIEKIQIYFGTADPSVQPELTPITVAEAIEIAQALTPEKGKSQTTADKYAVKGYVVGASSKTENTFYMADEAGAYGEFEAYKCKTVDREVAVGDLVIVTGKIQHYYGEGSSGEFHSYEISSGDLVHAEDQAIENVEFFNKAQKLMIDGVIYIIRDGKMYDLMGTQVR